MHIYMKERKHERHISNMPEPELRAPQTNRLAPTN